MTPESALHLAKARQCLANARVSLGVALVSDAGRSAYLAAFHAASAFIFERTGKFAKTHQGVQREFHRLARGETRLDASLPAFLRGQTGEGRIDLRRMRSKESDPGPNGTDLSCGIY